MSIADDARKLVDNIEKVVVGKTPVVQTVVLGLLAEGHVLLEDVPGVAKTMLAKALAASIGLSFNRIQGTPDLLPTDVTGVSVFNAKDQVFEFIPGPIFSNLVLVDELNRATPRTQSALLECMAERQVTIEGITRPLPKPFMVVATQNPLDFEGTFPLPDAQLDRFAIRTSVGYPNEAAELSLLQARRETDPLNALSAVWSGEDLLAAQKAVRQIHVDPQVAQYIVQLVSATRRHADVAMAASPRASLTLYRVAQADAAMQGMSYVVPERVKALYPLIVSHRISLSSAARIEGRAVRDVLGQIVSRIGIPTSVASG